MDVETFMTTGPVNGDVRAYEPTAASAFHPAAYGYLIDGNNPNAYRAAGQMLADSVRFSVSEDPVNVGDRSFARGTIIILKGNNKP